ncbi:unnamed protein product [Pleuronectes platessa]|uniref:Uncharacterized protein n=1 Tax=Pleuronectes platessa TaxID=8262 RepID=A0A9N7YYV3_PLEPL|nr:unnamed protein product [Pleuronectes platessa]
MVVDDNQQSPPPRDRRECKPRPLNVSQQQLAAERQRDPEREREIERDRDTEKESEIQRARKTGRDSKTQRERERHTQRHTETFRFTIILLGSLFSPASSSSPGCGRMLTLRDGAVFRSSETRRIHCDANELLYKRELATLHDPSTLCLQRLTPGNKGHVWSFLSVAGQLLSLFNSESSSPIST